VEEERGVEGQGRLRWLAEVGKLNPGQTR
jgi:hypothetical protein